MNELRLLVDSPFRRSLASGARQAARDSLELDTAGLGIVEGHTVAIDPVEVSIVWAYGLQWQPYPVYQTYSAYTDTLDELNADALSSASGPQFVLRQGPLHAIDGRYPLFESPAYELALTCNFTAQHFTSHWEVLRRVPSLCGKPRLLSTVSVAASTLLTVPRAGPNDMVVARFYVHQSLFERLLAKLFKPRGSPRITIDSKSFRFLTGTADEPHILCVPSSARLTEYGGGVCASTIALDGAGSVEVRFYAIRFS